MTPRLIPDLAATGSPPFGAVGTGVAIGPDDSTDKYTNADRGLGDAGPPGFGTGFSPDFLSDLIGTVLLPHVVKGLFGVQTR